MRQALEILVAVSAIASAMTTYTTVLKGKATSALSSKHKIRSHP
jgi:hypothetical protein